MYTCSRLRRMHLGKTPKAPPGGCTSMALRSCLVSRDSNPGEAPGGGSNLHRDMHEDSHLYASRGRGGALVVSERALVCGR
jgi:hypothetical protein